ncbi:AAA family ATPase [Pseudomonas sp. GD04087]|uniref:ExeA family protein n=1 Tax=unclassified Pseudomonas TaxID=196821 RepID=UPI00244B4B3B|nr:MULTISPECIES: AAA family ATPase [unclassified Pseudomonas]MDH0290613.1 AAA family ATPase [Pseudomonas sp. GD04087]MDH1051530.1 AAA family ATPase [Pseudomonas sp. GD03903]MDH2002743.1 AAA family ATPase [Pseudomonas sp. GD03691]
MQHLKEVLSTVKKAQRDLARAVEVSPATIAQIINHGQWPKSIDKTRLFGRIADFLYENGANDGDIAALEEEMEPRRANAEAPAAPENDQENEECQPMLMPKQPLLPATKQAFGLFIDPFDELRSADDMYVTKDMLYVRESMYQVAKNDGFLAVIGESGSGKSGLRKDLELRLAREGSTIIVIKPHVLGSEDNDVKGKTMKSLHIAEAIMKAIAPLEKPKSSPQDRFDQVENALKASNSAGQRHLLIIEEAHSLSIPLLKHLKRYRELEDGFTKLLSIILIGQPELAVKLSPRNAEVREVTQRIEITRLQPLPVNLVEAHLTHRLSRVDKSLGDVMEAGAVQALIERLSTSGKDKTSQLYPLAIANLTKAAMNLAVQIGEERVTADVVREVV